MYKNYISHLWDARKSENLCTNHVTACDGWIEVNKHFRSFVNCVNSKIFSMSNLRNILSTPVTHFTIQKKDPESKLYYWLHIFMKIFFWIQSCFSFLCMQISTSPFCVLKTPCSGRRRLRGNSWMRLTYADEIFTVYEDIKKVTHLHLRYEIFFSWFHQIHLRLSFFLFSPFSFSHFFWTNLIFIRLMLQGAFSRVKF